jgi:tRNA 2-thiouridine synthesizing protein A
MVTRRSPARKLRQQRTRITANHCHAFAFVDIACGDSSREKRAMADKTLDTKGLACPLPILKTKKALSEMAKGATLEVLATDPGSVPDFTAFCETTGNRLLEKSEQAGVYRFVIQHV